MSKAGSTKFACQACGYASPKWLGRCPNCQAWNTLVEEREAAPPGRGGRAPAAGPAAEPVWLDQVSELDAARTGTGLPEFDRVLGGGLVTGSFVLVGGDPGIGKSTLLLQAAAHLARARPPVLYVSAEESPALVKLRAARLGVPGTGLAILAATQLEALEEAVRRLKPSVAIVDSIQTVWSEGLGGAPGSVGQVRECAAQCLRLAKTTGTTLLVVCHVTKDGLLAGPRTLEHLADCVLEFEGDRHHLYRILRSVKNRFGSTSEIGVFEMTGAGLREVANLGTLFMPGEGGPVPGRAVAACMEGTRPLLVEVQALVASAAWGVPQRRTSGLESTRLAILLAVLESRLGCRLGQSDVFLNVAGGLLVQEPAADLAAALAVLSAHRERPLEKVALIGEVGLAGEIRPVMHLDRRLEEAARLGFTRAIVPRANKDVLPSTPKGLAVEGVADLKAAAGAALT